VRWRAGDTVAARTARGSASSETEGQAASGHEVFDPREKVIKSGQPIAMVVRATVSCGAVVM
jgi:hypothetical protein